MSVEILAVALGGVAIGWFVSICFARWGGNGEAWRGESAPMASAFEHLNEGVLVIDEAGLVRAMNSAAGRILSISGHEGSEMPAPLGDVGGAELAAVVMDVGKGAGLRPVEVSCDGGDRTLSVIVGPAGRARRFVVIEDLSDIARVDKRRRDFVANASHELQTPIAALVGMLELLEDADGDYADKLLRRSQRKVEALSTLTRDLIGLAKAQDTRWAPVSSAVRVEQLCRAVIEEHEGVAAEKGLSLLLDASPEIELIADPAALSTCLSNLVDNAVCYTDSGSVTVRVSSRAGAGVTFEVEDTGVGIPPDVLPRIFERFFSGDPTRSREAGGSGLGLAIVRNLMGRMGGRVAVSSLEGQGSCFQLELPGDPAHPLEGAGQALLSP